MSSSRQHLLTLSAMLLVIAFGSLCILSVEAQLAGKLIQNPCVNKRTCHECIQTQSCAWCMQPDHGDKPRCFQHSYSNICPEEFIWNPDTVQNFTLNRELSRAGSFAGAAGGQMSSGGSYQANSSYSSSSSGSYGAGASGEIVQISPQRVNLKLRINEVHSLQMQYSQAVDYPVDLYYLMDSSKSMEDDKEKLLALGDLLSVTMRNITSKFRVGLGSFAKIPKKFDHPCDGCEALYGYRNHMPLGTNTSTFTTEVKSAAVSGNSNATERGLDAIMQAIACRGQVGWREQARRVLVFSTNAGLRYAGDEVLGGVITPNDGQCHLNSEGIYTDLARQDYPSISQINNKVKENAIKVIFAVTASQYSVYANLSNYVEGSSSAVLSEDPSNIVDLVREEYMKISSSIVMKDNSTSHVKITYSSACLNGGPEILTTKCDNLRVGDVASFTVHILVTSCPTDPRDWNQIIEIYPIGIDESLIINLGMLCSCPCESPGAVAFSPVAQQCNYGGTYMCGICECDDMHFGHNCECFTTDIHSEKDNDFGCRPDNTTNVDCSGLGTCVCGICECSMRSNPEEIIYGQYCECDNFSCERNRGILCSGPEHGVCECGQCVCKPGWTGDSCDCRASTDTCMPQNGDNICSGHGECECGVCKCKFAEDRRYSGKYCEKCPTCPVSCHELKPCVQCQMYKTGPLKEENDCAKDCTTFVPISKDEITIDEEKDEHLCRFYDEDECEFTFKYAEVNNKVEVTARQERRCPPAME